MKKEIIIGALLLIIGFAMGTLCRTNHIREVTKKVTDTLVVRDTHIIEKPVLVEQTYYDSLYVAIHDTIRIKDSVFVALPIEKKIYKGEDYLAEISGYKANLERIEVYPKTTIIKESTVQTVTNRNALAIGFEMNYTDSPYIPIYLQYERMLHKNVGMYAKVFYDLPTQNTGVGLGIKLQVGW